MFKRPRLVQQTKHFVNIFPSATRVINQLDYNPWLTDWLAQVFSVTRSTLCYFGRFLLSNQFLQPQVGLPNTVDIPAILKSNYFAGKKNHVYERWEHHNSIKYNTQIDRIKCKKSHTLILYKQACDSPYPTMVDLNGLNKDYVQESQEL